MNPPTKNKEKNFVKNEKNFERKTKRSSMKNIVDGGEQIFENNVL